jgi:SulP family sulfate permease
MPNRDKFSAFYRDFCWKKIHGEVLGGVSGAVSSLPQSIAYGVIALAPLGSEYAVTGALAGIYSSITGGLVSSLAGSSPTMVSGSRAATAVIFAALLTQMLNAKSMNSDSLLALAFLAVILSGVMQVFLGLVRVGHLVKYVPQTVIAGFLNGSGILILAGQVRPLTGVSLSDLFSQSNSQWSNMEWGALALGLGTAAIMIITPRISKRVPAGLVALVTGTLAYHLTKHWISGSLVMGDLFPSVSSGLPTMSRATQLSSLLVNGQFNEWLPLLIPAALSIAVISSLDSLLSAAALDNLTLGRTNGNRELIGQGLGNLVTGFFGGTPSSGSMGRSGALFQAGGRSRWAVIVNVSVLIVVVLGLGPMLGLIPKAVVAGVLLVIGVQLFDDWTIRLLCTDFRDRQWTDFRSDFLVILCVVTATLIWNLITAVGLGILLAVIIFVRRMSRSIIRRRYKGNHVHSRQVREDQVASLLENYGNHIAVLELEGAIFFGSADGLEMEIDSLSADGVDYFVLDMKRIKDIDSSGAFILQRIHQRLNGVGKFLVLSYIDKERRSNQNLRANQYDIERRQFSKERRLWRMLSNFGLIDSFGESAFLPDTDSALGVCESLLLRKLTADDAHRDALDPLKTGIFGSLTRDEMALVRPLLTHINYAKGTVIFHQGEPGDALYILVWGVADVVINIPGGRQKRVQTLFPGAVFGEMALMDGESRAASVVVVEEVDCLKLSSEDFAVLMADHPQIALKLFTKIGILFARRLRAANMMIMELET